MKRSTMYSAAIAMVSTFIFATSVQASGDHDSGHGDDHHDSAAGHNDQHEKGMGHKKEGMFLKEVTIDGYKVSFHIMKAKSGEEMGGSHNFMIKVEKDSKALTDVTINTKVVHPNGKGESKRVMKMGDWYMAGYDLGHEGKHQVMILFKTADGKKHKGGIYY
jgi:hypothetical protein